jgi:sporulation protein YlmC with PRC-barrel domain
VQKKANLEDDLQERSLIGLEARVADGTEVGRIVEVVTDEEGGEVTYVIVETEEGEQLEVPLTSLSLDPDVDFATFRADASDVEPGDHTNDEVGFATENSDPNANPTSEVEPQGYSRDDLAEEQPEDYEHEGQLVTESEYEEDAETEEDLETREDWEDESYTPDSGYPRNDTYVNPDTGEVEEDPLLSNVEGVQHDVAELLDGTELKVGNVREGAVELTGTASTQEDLDEIVREVMGLDEVLEVDTTDVDVG